MAQVIEQPRELRLGAWIRVGRDLKRQLLVPGFETLCDDPANVGHILIPILDCPTKRDRGVKFQRDQGTAGNDSHLMSEHRGRLRDARRRLENRVGLARNKVCDRFGVIRIGRRWVYPHHILGVGDHVTSRSERVRQRSELGPWHEHVDVDRRAQPAVIAHRDASNHGMI